MDEDQAELLKLIFTRFAMMIEDASVVALELGGRSNEFEPVKVDELI